jgi:hypothetical protein
MLLHGCPQAETSEERQVRQQLKVLLEVAAAQQVESSASRQQLERGWAGAPSAHGRNPPPSRHQDRGEGAGRRRQRSRAGSGLTAALKGPCDA